MSFRVGDVVRLNSGGPLMTVWRLADNGEIDCVWFDGKEVVATRLPPEVLYFIASADEDDEDEMSDEELDELMAESELQQYGYR